MNEAALPTLSPVPELICMLIIISSKEKKNKTHKLNYQLNHLMVQMFLHLKNEERKKQTPIGFKVG